MFNIIRLDTGDAIENEAGETLTFENGKEAAERAKELAESLGVKCQPRKVITDTSWHDRERQRFANDTYSPLAWQSLSVWRKKIFDPVYDEFERANNASWNELYWSKSFRTSKAREEAYEAAHKAERELVLKRMKGTGEIYFAHVSLDDPSMIAFTKNDLMGVADRQTRLSPKSFLERYFGDRLTADEIALCVKAHDDEYLATVQVKFATTPDEIQWTYAHYDESVSALVGSCMRCSSVVTEWQYGPAPVRVYGAGDLAIAYLTNTEGRVTARCLCWPDRKVYGRVYASNDKLHRALRALGYVKGDYYDDAQGTFEGARLLKIQANFGDGEVFVMPYLDGRLGVKAGRGDNRGFFIITHEDDGESYETHTTNGTTCDDPSEYEDDRMSCERCEERVYDLSPVRTAFRWPHRVEHWCACCIEDNSFYCDATDTYYSRDTFDDVELANGDTWESSYFSDNGFESELTDDAFHNDLAVSVITSTDGDTQTWARPELAGNAFEHEGKWYANELADQISNIAAE